MAAGDMASTRLGAGRQHLRPLKRRGLVLLRLTAIVFAVLLFCEFLIYYLVIFRCSWPAVKTPADAGGLGTPEPVLRAMFLADTHLLGAVRGHWLDKLRREWQMERAFQTALWLLQPEVVFILGDIFDEGKWSSSQAWADDVGRFWKIFRHPPHVQLRAVAGNHDIGFHYQMNTYKIKRFEKVFSPERLFSWKGINFCVPGTQSPADCTGGPWLISCPCLSFVMVNSVALEGDGCDICSGAEAELLEISHRLNCSREQEHRPQECGDGQRLPASAPILLQHFPLYRRNDANCSGEDAAPPDEKYTPFKERYDALSQEASRKLLWWLRPRLVLSGHTHSACEVLHGAGVLEVSVPSFSWRNRNNPSFIMGSVTPTEYALAKCYLPCEDTVLTTYCTAAGGLMLLTLVHAGLVASPFHFGWNMLRKFKTT
ncbi:metallophosphoesterase 1 isoform X1 [Balaenoptera musculus]|uniref:Metallophosphoesterase 1 n=1 Tax=Balaenoptera musculus TaxID=9771 RepID=A0A8B8V3L3_BALMU|nr:metallophosphoesterase 1 isoform X1 [Balaenoptera musculus]XP_036679411.1 metallophosphoesterase 1 isoform X1 [Balaenoptera musculus]XP_036679413.1 metallophosphoesterase 1 isoform X1 [Balaenoptera musculus]XP_036679414.1 metallophosphoesterase 1 isoform X1 [Balaenoptera musculus]XP_036679415.1 metallophosphoesterase 1 isoform X1 [Balaenoptera musculus]XP_036679416.1 metallophosphoesterase 1 isoform X1 [Balaenoptera musculus]XP_036679417.1 metallophosphoesterase 1 isoform X1 [Balaenoptera 